VEIEYVDGRRTPLRADRWITPCAGDDGLLDRCHGATLDVGSGPGRLVVALGERALPALGIDITPYAVEIARTAGGLALLRDAFGRVPGAGRWDTVLLADGNIGIGGDPRALLRRMRELLRPGGRLLAEVEAPGTAGGVEWVRLVEAGRRGDWFRWARVCVDDMPGLAGRHGLQVTEVWREAGRWFVHCTA
jgi:SAM-dependent methyltransferase